jgi:hypothetical protein
LRLILVFLVAAAAMLIGSPAQAATPTHVWAMDEPDGTGTMLDTGGPTQTPGTWEHITAGVPGFTGTAYRFNGSSSRVVVHDDASLDPGASSFTFTVHVRFTTMPTAAIGGDYDLIRKGLGSTKGGYWKMEIYPSSNGSVALGLCQMKGSLGAAKIQNAPHSLNDGAWHTITCTKDDTGIALTVDGTRYFKAVKIGSIANGDPLTLGAKNIGGDWYDGDMDVVSYQTLGGNIQPTASDQTVSVSQDTPKTITLTGTDDSTCELTFSVDPGSVQGGGVANLSSSNNNCTSGNPNQDTATVTYTPPSGFTGQDSFTFTTTDGDGLNSAPGTITINVGTAPPGISLRSASSAANTTEMTLQIPAPQGLQSGDIRVSEVAARGTASITAPAGWVLIRTDVSGTPQTQSAYYKVATGSEPTNYTWTLSSSEAAAGGILAYTGVDAQSPIDAQGGQSNSKSTSITAPSITTSVSGDALVAFFDITQNNTVTSPGSMTERFDLASNAVMPFLTAEGADEIQPSAGPTGPRVATASIDGKSIGQLIALRPNS